MYKLNHSKINISVFYTIFVILLLMISFIMLYYSYVVENANYEKWSNSNFCGYVTSHEINYNDTDKLFHANIIISTYHKSQIYQKNNKNDTILKCICYDYQTGANYNDMLKISNNLLKIGRNSFVCLSKTNIDGICTNNSKPYKKNNFSVLLFLSTITILSLFLTIAKNIHIYN